MQLTPGTRLGPYEITAQLGVGGMGEVYRATDTTLGRQVALKVLPEAFAQDADRLARFEREARTLAALNHPNIATIHGVEKAPGAYALVMELVEGPTLADRIAQAVIPVDEALPIARQIAEALEAAHEQGIIHRDLKPANIKVRPDGTVKVLDFGLAKAMAPAGAVSPGVSQSPTITTPAMTQMGMILGTAAYMSPEQAKGRVVDARADVWAFGAVLFEMLSGRRAFDGEDTTDVLGAVVRLEPAWEALPSDVPPRVRQVIRACLQKPVKQRVAHIQDARLALEGAFESQVPGLVQPLPPTQPVWRRALPYAVGAIAAGVVLGLAAWSQRAAPAPQPLSRFAHVIPSGQQLRGTGNSVLALSPDGRSVVYSTSAGLYVRAMDELEARLIPGNEDSINAPFFSPDGRSVAYLVGNTGQLKRITLSGGVPVLITGGIDQSAGGTYFFGGNWATDGTILFGHRTGIMRVSANGGTPELVIAATKGEAFYGPQVLPDGDSVLFSVTIAIGDSRWDEAQIVVQSLTTGQRTVVLEGGSDARYVPTGHLTYAMGDGLFAVAFDLDTLTTSGGAVPLVQGVLRAPGAGTNTAAANYGVSDDGTLVYMTGRATDPARLVWVGRDGRGTPAGERVAPYRSPRISPDGERIAVEMGGPEGNRDIWVIDLARGSQSRLTTEAALDSYPLWTTDGARIAFTSNRAGSANALYWTAADGSGTPERLTDATSNQGPTSWSPDGRTLAFYDVGNTYDIFTVTPGEAPVRLLETKFREQGPTFSPDGRWLAYSSDETGRDEIYVMPYPGPGGKIAISTGGGRSPRWSANGRELFYRNGREMLVVAVEPGPALGVGSPRVLFEGDYVQENRGQGAHNYDVSADGRRFLMMAPVEQVGGEPRNQIVVVQNFFAELRRLVPVN